MSQIEIPTARILDSYLDCEVLALGVSYLPRPVFGVADQMKSEGKLLEFDFKVVDPELTRENYVDKLGFTADPKIVDLVVAFNRLGIPTTGSGEGHPKYGNRYTRVSFRDKEIFRVVAAIKDWNPGRNVNKVCFMAGKTTVPESFGTYFGLVFISNDLDESQNLVGDLAKYLERNSRP